VSQELYIKKALSNLEVKSVTASSRLYHFDVPLVNCFKQLAWWFEEETKIL